MELNERLEGFIKSRIKDRVNESMFDKIVEEDLNLETADGRVGEINEAIDNLTSVIVKTLMEKRS